MSKTPVLVISTYPPKGTTHSHHLSAVASYTKNTLVSISKNTSQFAFTVLADQLPPENTNPYFEDKIRVERVWRRNTPLLFLDLLKAIRGAKDTQKILFCFEWAMFGGRTWISGFLPIFLLLLRLMNKKVYLVSHAVLLDADTVVGQLGSTKGSPKSRLLTVALKFLYWSIVVLSFRVIVFEEALRKQLLNLIPKHQKIITIPHGVEEISKKTTIRNARKVLKIPEGELVVMVFGFMIWYKGTDWIAENFAEYFKKHPQSKMRLYLVGGETPKYIDNPAYRAFLERIKVVISQYPDKVINTGFIDEKDIPMYFAAADIVVFPYRVFVSSSGPLSWSFSSEKPILLSSRLSSYFDTADMREALRVSGLTEKDILFDFSRPRTLFKSLIRFRTSPIFRAKLGVFSSFLHRSRSWNTIGSLYAEVLLK